MPDYQWHLTRYIGTDENGPMESIVAPSRDLGEGLNNVFTTMTEEVAKGQVFNKK